MMAVLKQERFKPMPTWEQALLIYAVSNGAADKWEPARIPQFETEFLNWMKTTKGPICEQLKTGNKMSKEQRSVLNAALAEFGERA